LRRHALPASGTARPHQRAPPFSRSCRTARPGLGVPARGHRAALDRAASAFLSGSPVMTSLHEPSGTRIWDRCQELARFSEETGALTRVFLSREQSAANELTRGWMRAAGMSAGLDAIGNVVGRYEASTPAAPCLMLGSH